MAEDLRRETADALLESIRDIARKSNTAQVLESLAQAYALTTGAMPKGDGGGRKVTVG